MGEGEEVGHIRKDRREEAGAVRHSLHSLAAEVDHSDSPRRGDGGGDGGQTCSESRIRPLNQKLRLAVTPQFHGDKLFSSKEGKTDKSKLRKHGHLSAVPRL